MCLHVLNTSLHCRDYDTKSRLHMRSNFNLHVPGYQDFYHSVAGILFVVDFFCLIEMLDCIA